MDEGVTRRGIVGVATLLVGVMLVGLWALQRQLVYFPGGEPPPVEQVLPDAEAVTFATSDGLELGAWWLPRGPVTVLVLPGNAGNRAVRAPLAEALAAHDLSVLLVDYRGYGGNPGNPTEEGLLRDARAARRWLADRGDVERVVYFGESLGTGVAVQLAVGEGTPDALVLRSPFPSLVAVAREHYGPVPRWLLKDRFETLDALPQVAAPLLVVAGAADDIIPTALSRQVAEAAPEPSRFVLVEGAGHNDRALLDGRELVDAVIGFLHEHDVLPAAER